MPHCRLLPLNRARGVTDPDGVTSASLPPFAGKVTRHDVRFAYPARPGVEVLKSISFSPSLCIQAR